MGETTSKDQVKTSFNNIDFLYLFLSKRNFLFFFLVLFFIAGVIFAFITPKTYNSSVISIPQVSSSSAATKKYSKIASLVGLNLGGDRPSNISPNIYPLVMASKPYQRDLLQTPLTIKGQDSLITLATYLKDIKKPSLLDGIKKYTIGLPGLIVSKLSSEKADSSSAVRDSTIISIAISEKTQMAFLEENITMSYDELEGYVEIIGVMPEPLASAELTQNAHKLLQKYIINLTIEKSKEQLDYISKRLSDTEENFFNKRTALSNFDERNRNTNSAFLDNRRDQLKFEYDLAYSLYSNLSQQYEATKLQVKQDTPIFTIVKPVVVPISESSPNKIAIILGFMIFGFFIGMILIFYKHAKQFLRYYLSKKEPIPLEQEVQ